MRSSGLVLSALLVLAPAAHACINAVGTDHTGRRFSAQWYVGEEMARPLFHQWQRRNWMDRAPEVIAAARRTPDFATLTDLGVLLVYQGQYPLAVRHFLMLERRFPGRYQTAANLGTALELAGHDAPALRWIRIGMQRNRQSHQGTEWLHARILEAKLAQARDPRYLATHSVAGVAFADEVVPSIPAVLPAGNDGVPVKPWELNLALSYQLRERTQFVSPPDPVVANLMRDWATLNLAGGPIENAQALYAAAVHFGAPHDALMRQREAYVDSTLARVGRRHVEPRGRNCAICMPFGP